MSGVDPNTETFQNSSVNLIRFFFFLVYPAHCKHRFEEMHTDHLSITYHSPNESKEKNKNQQFWKTLGKVLMMSVYTYDIGIHSLDKNDPKQKINILYRAFQKWNKLFQIIKYMQSERKQ